MDAVVAEEDEPFVHLHTHTEFSLLDGAARIPELVQTAARLRQPAIAMTDHGAMYGTVRFFTAAKEAGIKPIIGCEMYVAPRSRLDREGRADRDPNHLILLARNDTGYRNLIKLVSRSHIEGYYYKPRVDKEILAEHAEGLVCLSACIGGELPQAILGGDMDAAERIARQHMEIFGRDAYFLELQDHGIPEEDVIRPGLVEIARRTGLPLVATNDSHYVSETDAEAHDILLCIQTQARRDDPNRFKFHGPYFHMTGGTEMRRRFSSYADAVSNTLAVADLCNVELALGGNLLPQYSPIPPGHTAESYLEELCEVGLRERYGDGITEEARERLAMELDVIASTGFAPYFLIVWDLIRAARCDGVVVGPGRGSAAGSLVSYVLRITNICPLRYGLIFERFLNRERVEMPDIDIDFDDQRRDRVLQYVQGKYGEDHVAQIITFGTLAARAAIRDVGRALNTPLPDVDRLAKMVPLNVGITLDRAIAASRELRELYEGEGWARQVIDNARKLEGIPRNASTHAAGVVIGARPLADVVPLQRSTTGDRDNAVTMFDMQSVAKVGLLKIDFLGLSNLTVIDDTLRIIAATRGVHTDADAIPLDDEPTFALLGRGDTHGVFQFEGTFAKRILIDMQPRSLLDVSIAGALNRPGPIEGGVVDLYLRRKRGELPVDYVEGLEPYLEPVLAETHGTIVYQDQVMKIAQRVAGFTLGEADLLRGAMGKKDAAKMAKQRQKFLAGAALEGIDAGKAEDLFELMAKFAGYGFNKAHSVAYGLISYQTAYLKANHPLEFATALLNSRAGDFDKLKQSILDAHAHGLVVHKPDINRSAAGFSVGDMASGEILFGLQHIKNVGAHVTEAVIAARDAGGPFTSLLDVCLRVESRDLNRRVMESLIRCGALDELGSRGALLRQLDACMDHAAAVRRERDVGQTSLFGDAVDIVGTLVPPLPELTETSGDAADESWLTWERDLLGMYLSDHPLRRIAATLQERVDTSINELGAHLDGLIVQVGGCIRDVRAFVPRSSTTGRRMAFLQLEDLTGTCEVVVFDRVFEEAAELLRPDAVIVVRGKVELGRPTPNAPPAGEDEAHESDPTKIRADVVYAYEDARLVAWRRNITVHVRIGLGQDSLIGALQQAIREHRGDAPVVVHVETRSAIDEVALDSTFNVEPGPGLERSIEALLGEGAYRVETRRERAPEPARWGGGRR
ncbi:MAG: DNA polymerase III subunit alpha [Candidatus Dormibacteria bacterium]